MVILTAFSSKLNYTLLLCIPLFINAINMGLIPTICITLSGEDIAFGLLLPLSFICGICTACLNVAGFGFASIFSPKHTEGVMVGQGIDGLISLIPLIVHLAAGDGHENAVGLSFFMISVAIDLIACASVLLLRKIPYSRYVMIQTGILKPTDTDLSEYKSLLQENQKTTETPMLSEGERKEEEEGEGEGGRGRGGEEGRGGEGGEGEGEEVKETTEKPPLSKPEKVPELEEETERSNLEILKGFIIDIWYMAKKKKWWGVAIFSNYFITLIGYPTVVLNIPPPLDSLDEDDYSRSTWTVCISFLPLLFFTLLIYYMHPCYYICFLPLHLSLSISICAYHLLHSLSVYHSQHLLHL